MSLKAVLFDLDGTLLPMDFDVFLGEYLKGISAKMAPLGYEPKELISNIWAGTEAMRNNIGEKTNESVFWDLFISVYGEKVKADMHYFEEFYANDFQKIREVCGRTPKALEIVRKLKALGIRTVLATSPIFPAIATESRIRWAGLRPQDFEIYTTYENINYCKPNTLYYLEIAKRLGLNPQDCLMVGNDVDDDMPAEKIGMKVFLLTDNLINNSNTDISLFPKGNFDKLEEYIHSIMA